MKAKDKINELVREITRKNSEICENTIFELIQISGCGSLDELENKGYEIRKSFKGTETTFSLYERETHIITYIVFVEIKENVVKVKRKRLVNNIEVEA